MPTPSFSCPSSALLRYSLSLLLSFSPVFASRATQMTLVLSRSGSLSSATPTTTRTSPPPPHSSLPPGYTSSASASNHTPRPLQEEKTEPYYADDSYKDPPPPAHVLASEFGVKI
ncbi:hypothetical protein F5051DRAFT_423274, partial [Lentinula edodes]